MSSWGFALALAAGSGILLAGYGSAAGAWTAYVLTIPFMVFVLPYFLGASLLKGGGDGKRTIREECAATTLPVNSRP